MKRHTHFADSCRVRKFWLKSKEDNDLATANIGDVENVTPSDTNELDVFVGACSFSVLSRLLKQKKNDLGSRYIMGKYWKWFDG